MRVDEGMRMDGANSIEKLATWVGSVEKQLNQITEQKVRWNGL